MKFHRIPFRKVHKFAQKHLECKNISIKHDDDFNGVVIIRSTDNDYLGKKAIYVDLDESGDILQVFMLDSSEGDIKDIDLDIKELVR